MILREVAIHRYAVYAVCDLLEQCAVEGFLQEHWQSYPKAMRDLNSALRDWTPQYGPPFEVEERAKRLREGICEFRAREKRKKREPRILFFEDGSAVICTNAFFKESSTPDDEIDKAIAIRKEYIRQKQTHLRILKGWAYREREVASLGIGITGRLAVARCPRVYRRVGSDDEGQRDEPKGPGRRSGREPALYLQRHVRQ